MTGGVSRMATSLASSLGIVQLGLGLAIVALAALEYRDDRRRSIAFLGAGVAVLTVVQFVVTLLVSQTGPIHMIPLSTQAVELVGLALILYAIVLVRRQ